MKIINLTEDTTIYTCNVYLVLGSWNALKDENTLVDVGRDPMIFQKLDIVHTGVGKRKIDRVVITHNHYDHIGQLPDIRNQFHPKVFAFSRSLDGVDIFLNDGDTIMLGDRQFEVIHTPGHSNDSICLYCEADGVLFSGDTPLIIRSGGYTYDTDFINALERISRRDIKIIYPGHGAPLKKDCNLMIKTSLKNIKTSAFTTDRPN